MVEVGQICVIWSRCDLLEFGPTVVEETEHALHHALFYSSGASERVGHWRVADVFEHWRSSNILSQLITEDILIVKKLDIIRKYYKLNLLLHFENRFQERFVENWTKCDLSVGILVNNLANQSKLSFIHID